MTWVLYEVRNELQGEPTQTWPDEESAVFECARQYMLWGEYEAWRVDKDGKREEVTLALRPPRSCKPISKD